MRAVSSVALEPIWLLTPFAYGTLASASLNFWTTRLGGMDVVMV